MAKSQPFKIIFTIISIKKAVLKNLQGQPFFYGKNTINER